MKLLRIFLGSAPSLACKGQGNYRHGKQWRRGIKYGFRRSSVLLIRRVAVICESTSTCGSLGKWNFGHQASGRETWVEIQETRYSRADHVEG
jgi:hypothetical protein